MRGHLPLASIFLAAGLLDGGCAERATPSRDQAAADRRPEARPTNQAKYDVKQASAESKLAQPAQPAQERRADAPQELSSDVAIRPLDEVPHEDLTMPRVLLGQAQAQKCRVLVGDAFPEFELKDMSGKPQQLAGLLGKKLTVVVFWNAREATALEELADLGPRIQRRFADDGVEVVGINTGDEPKLASELLEQAGAKFVNLSDPDGSAYAQVATGKRPHTYLLDAWGKIVWFDIEYSHTTRRDLAQAIRYLLAAD